MLGVQHGADLCLCRVATWITNSSMYNGLLDWISAHVYIHIWFFIHM